ncbi:YbhB/YbcL family Raf kinase inhibitor-like protein [Haladaptatus sp. ZSTT2]|uniref:YbhB/YbcL family Raf kinase inhibitor-like protein n=1 Tax=Haladaptatus sp. ZSTT2 TaxID=3120515 RepID=UPI00300EB848
MTTFTLTSSAFADSEPIPRKYGYKAENVNPPLSIAGVPEGTQSLALVMDDPDAMEPARKVWDHWVVWNVAPTMTEISEGWNQAGATVGKNSFGESGYGGPSPPDKAHTYRFFAYALDKTLSLEAGATKADLQSAMEGHVLAESLLTGTYAP